MLLLYPFPNVNILDIFNPGSGENYQKLIHKIREDCTNSFKDNYLELDFNVTHRAGDYTRYADGDNIRGVKSGGIAFFINYRLTSSCGKEIEEIETALVICFLYKFMPSS